MAESVVAGICCSCAGYIPNSERIAKLLGISKAQWVKLTRSSIITL